LMGSAERTQPEADAQRDIGNGSRRVVAPMVAPATGKTCQNESQSGKIGKVCRPTESGEKTKKPRDLRGFNESGRQDLNLRPLRPERSALPG